jgi:hypothetical protein
VIHQTMTTPSSFDDDVVINTTSYIDIGFQV